MKVAVIAVGIPGSGKTTTLKPLAEKYGLAYVNGDDIREELWGDPRDQSDNKKVWLETNRRTAEALKDRGVVVDRTFVEAWKRKEAITFVRAHGADRVIGIYFAIPFETSSERNEARDRIVAKDVMHWMHTTLTREAPSLADGFDALYTHEELDRVEDELGR